MNYATQHQPQPFVIELVTDERELAVAQKQREQFDRNSAWLQQHIAEIYPPNRGKFLCIAGEQAFVGDSVEEAVARAIAAHPDDQGRFTRYIPREKVAMIYASKWRMARMR